MVVPVLMRVAMLVVCPVLAVMVMVMGVMRMRMSMTRVSVLVFLMGGAHGRAFLPWQTASTISAHSIYLH
jgi:hypothetical protein